jgi:hypothetical protein
MPRIDLPPPSDQEDLIAAVERLKNGLISAATYRDDDTFTDTEYRKIRKHLLGHPGLKKLLPEFLTSYRNVGEFWNFIKVAYAHYDERRTFIAEALNPILNLLESNEEIESQFEEMEWIGQGGFGTVYKYVHTHLQLPFAIKVLAPSLLGETDGNLDRFFREARILFRLNHLNIIRCYDVGMLGRRPYIKMEYFNGKDLNQALMQHGRFSANKALRATKLIAQALVHAHEVGVVHRDLRPSNVLIAPVGQLRVIDFGLGVFVEGELISRITRTGESVVGGYYTAPELVANPKLLDPRSDLYSVGALWYTLLVGQPPGGTSLGRALQDIKDVTDAYRNAVLRCLADIDERFQSATEVVEAIQELERS